MTAEKIEAFWENATAYDVAQVMEGETVEARFRDSKGVKWVENGCSLAGWCAGVWTSSSGLPWNQCQVYREPSWYANKPDPGLGFRLLGKFPDEELKPGDEGWDLWHDGKWGESDFAREGKPQQEKTWYRRRIEPVEPGPQHYVLKAGDSCETPCGNRINVIPQGGTQRVFKFKVGDIVTTIHGQTITITEKGFKVAQ
jgi:hypothetical protein